MITEKKLWINVVRDLKKNTRGGKKIDQRVQRPVFEKGTRTKKRRR